jgi:hypothetical protein
MEDADIFYGHLAYISAFWYILWTFGIFNDFWAYSSVLVCCTNKNLATLTDPRSHTHIRILESIPSFAKKKF